jgi:hypothetical protein
MSECPARALHVHLLDANGVVVPVELFNSFVDTAEGGIVHVVGIKEDADPAHWRSNADEEYSSLAIDIAQSQLNADVLKLDENCISVSSCSSVDSRIVTQSTCKEADVLDGDAVVWFNVLSKDFDIIRYNDTFRSLGGRKSVRMPLKEWISEKSGPEFDRAVEYVSNVILNSVADEVQYDIPSLVLKPPCMSSRTRNLEVFARGSVVVIDFDEIVCSSFPDDDGERLCVRLTLTDISQKYRRHSGNHQKGVMQRMNENENDSPKSRAQDARFPERDEIQTSLSL